MKNYLILFFLISSTAQTHCQNNVELIVKNKIDHIYSLAREPMIAQHPSGVLFLSGYKNESDEPQLWKSEDLGKNWQIVNVGNYEEGAQGNSDVDLFIDEEGNIYFLSMSYTKIPADMSNFDFSSLKGEQITLGISRDLGKSWKWQNISKSDYDDRPWISQTTNGDLHIIWNDGNGVHHSLSKDQGEHWERQAKVYPKGGSSHMVAGHHGQLAVRVAPLSASANKIDPGVDLLRLSLDNGKSWQDVSLPGNRNWTQDLSGLPRWVEPLAFDREDRLYTLWSEGQELKLGVSNNNGEDWEEQVIAQAQDTMYFPFMKASDDYLLCTWLSGFKENIRHHAAVLQLENGKWEVYQIEPQKLDIRARFNIGPNELSTGGEYFPIIQLSNGNFGMATTIQNYKAKRLGFSWWELILNKY